MYSLRLSLILICILHTKSFDPDSDICRNTSLDSSVNSVDGKTYIFKGSYYWQTTPLNIKNGTMGYADPIKNKWPEIDSPIISAFTLQTPKYLTVFVCANKWIAYEKGGKVLKGSTENWPKFQDLTLNTMFSIDFTKSEIFAIYDNSHRFHVYDFTDINEPKVVRSGITSINVNFLWFIDDKNPSDKSSNSLKNILKVKTSISYADTLVLMSANRYCRVNLLSPAFERKCQIENELVFYLIGCPLDLRARTSPKPTTKSKSTLSSSSSTHLTVSSQSSTNSWTMDSMIPINKSSAEELYSETKTKSKSMVIVAVIIGVIVVIVIALMVGIIMIIMSSKKTKTQNKSLRNGSQMVSRKSLATIQTVNSQTGKPLKSKSIESLREASQ